MVMISTSTFEAYTLEHLAPILFFTALVWLMLQVGKGKSMDFRVLLGVLLSMSIPVMIVKDLCAQLAAGTFDPTEDLPLHLCRIVCFFLPYAIWRQSRWWMGILYFLVLAGTLQAVLTPDLAEGFPLYLYFRYWLLHAGLIAFTVYGVIILRIRPSWRDFGRAVIAAQIYLVVTLPVNYLLKANYGYTFRKPPIASIADYMGPWPWYILTGEVIMLVLFLILLLPFIAWKRRTVAE